MKKLLLIAAIAFPTLVHAGECEEETIQGITRGGHRIVLESGSIYEVTPGDISEVALWNAGDDALVCGDDEIINKSNGSRVDVTPVR